MRNFGVNIKDKPRMDIELDSKSIDELKAKCMGIGKLISSLEKL
jgi:hypothetical protein